MWFLVGWQNKPWIRTIEGLSRRKPYVTFSDFDFVVFKIPSFACVIGFSSILNICKIDNKVEERRRRQKKVERSILVISFEPSIERERGRGRGRGRGEGEGERERERDTEIQREPRKSRERPRIFDRAEKPSESRDSPHSWRSAWMRKRGKASRVVRRASIASTQTASYAG